MKLFKNSLSQPEEELLSPDLSRVVRTGNDAGWLAPWAKRVLKISAFSWGLDNMHRGFKLLLVIYFNQNNGLFDVHTTTDVWYKTIILDKVSQLIIKINWTNYVPCKYKYEDVSWPINTHWGFHVKIHQLSDISLFKTPKVKGPENPPIIPCIWNIPSCSTWLIQISIWI